MNKDSFYTRRYNGGYIHGHYDRVKGHEVFEWQIPGERSKPAKTYVGAQRAITKEVRKLYLDWLNNFISIEAFADYYNMTEIDAQHIISAGRKLAAKSGRY